MNWNAICVIICMYIYIYDRMCVCLVAICRMLAGGSNNDLYTITILEITISIPFNLRQTFGNCVVRISRKLVVSIVCISIERECMCVSV